MNLPRTTYPPLNMHFILEFQDKYLSEDINFHSVQGLHARICKEENTENKFVHFENLILKRAYLPNSKLVKWCMDAINNNKEQPVNLTIKLLNANHEMLSGWQIEKAMPIAWSVEELHAQETKILMEIIELKYHKFHVLDSKGRNVAPSANIKTIKANKS